MPLSTAVVVFLLSEMAILGVLGVAMYLFNTADLFTIFYPGVGDINVMFRENFVYYFQRGFRW